MSSTNNQTPPVEHKKMLLRSPEHAMIAGVCSGLGEFTGMHRWVIRVLFLVLLLLGGFAGIMYLILWVFIPEEKDFGKAPTDVMHANTDSMRRKAYDVTEGVKQATDRNKESGQ